MVPLSRVVCLGVWIIVGSGIGCIHVFREHLLSLVNMTLLKQVRESMAIGATELITCVGLTWFTELGSLASINSILLINCVIFASAAIQDSIECILVLKVVGLVFSGQDSH